MAHVKSTSDIKQIHQRTAKHNLLLLQSAMLKDFTRVPITRVPCLSLKSAMSTLEKSTDCPHSLDSNLQTYLHICVCFFLCSVLQNEGLRRFIQYIQMMVAGQVSAGVIQHM